MKSSGAEASEAIPTPSFGEGAVKQLLLREAAKTIFHKGYVLAGIQEIAESVGATKADLNRYFGKKRSFFRTMVDLSLMAYHIRLERGRRRVGAAPIRLWCLLEDLYSLLAEHEDLARLMRRLDMGPMDGTPMDVTGVFSRAFRETAVHIVEEGIAEGSFREGHLEETVDAVQAVFDLAVARLLEPGGRGKDLEGLGRMLRVLYQGIERR